MISYKDTQYNKFINSIYDKVNSISAMLKSYNINIPLMNTSSNSTCSYLNKCCRNISNITTIYTQFIYKTIEHICDKIHNQFYCLVYNPDIKILQYNLIHNSYQQLIQRNQNMIKSNEVKATDENIVMISYQKDKDLSVIKNLLTIITKHNIFSPIHHNSYYLLYSHVYSIGNQSMEQLMMYINTIRITIYLTCLFTYKLNHSSFSRYTWVMKIIYIKICNNIRNKD